MTPKQLTVIAVLFMIAFLLTALIILNAGYAAEPISLPPDDNSTGSPLGFFSAIYFLITLAGYLYGVNWNVETKSEKLKIEVLWANLSMGLNIRYAKQEDANGDWNLINKRYLYLCPLPMISIRIGRRRYPFKNSV